MYRHFHSFSFHSRIRVIEMLEHIWQYELQSHIDRGLNGYLIEHLETTAPGLWIETA